MSRGLAFYFKVDYEEARAELNQRMRESTVDD